MEEMRLEFDEMRTQWQDDHDELQRLRAAPPAPTVVVQRERKLRRYSGLDEPALEDWIDEARSCINTQRLEGEAAASFLISYLDGAARSEMRCQPSDVRRDANLIFAALEDVYGEKETANQLLRRFFFRRQMAGEPISAYSHGLVEIANRINRLVPKPDEERDSMLRDQFVENLRDAHLRWELKRRIETDEDIDFLSLRKVAMLWAEEVEGATQRKVHTNAIEAGAKTNAVGPADEMARMWAELASQRRQLTEGLAEQGKVLTEVLAQQRHLMASTSAMFPPFGQQAAPRRRLEDIVCYGCNQKGHIRRNCPATTATLN